MKKLLVILFTLFLSFSLAGCGLVGNDTTITVNYQTNGASEIESTKVSIENVGSFKLPTNITKEGYEFGGWFIDENFTNSFDSLDTSKKEITLYAKWNEIILTNSSIKADATLNFLVDLSGYNYYGEESQEISEPEDLQTVYAKGMIELACSVEDKEVEKIEDVKANLVLLVKLETEKGQNNSIFNSVPIAVTLAVSDGNLYVTYGLVSYKIDLVKVYDEAEKQIKEQLEIAKDNGIVLPEEGKDYSELISSEIEKIIKEYQLDTTVLNDLLLKVLEVLPKPVVSEDGKVTFKVNSESLFEGIDELIEYFKENAQAIIQEFLKLKDIISSPKETLEESQEIDMEEFSSFVSGMVENIYTAIKSMLVINNLEFNYDPNKQEVGFNLDLDLNTEAVKELFSKIITGNVKVDFNFKVTKSTDEVVIPSYEAAVDMTDEVINSIKNDNNITGVLPF